ncbi:MAG TPA: UvrD-helicase domain-containing protein [Ktedonobacteraceae bacterium]
MKIATALLKKPYIMNEAQQAIVSHKRGPLLVVAGPDSGKTRSLSLLAMNLLLCGDAEASQIVLCTYTEKAAYELEDRLTSIARDVHYTGDLSQIRAGTIHRICQQLIADSDPQHEAEQLAELIDLLKRRGKIKDYSDVALLLYSVRPEKSDPYIQALAGKDIPVYCPRARAFFQQAEIMLMLGCFAFILQYSAREQSTEIREQDFSDYLADSQQRVTSWCQRHPALTRELQRIAKEVQRLADEEEGDFNVQYLISSFYQLIFEEPFLSLQKRESARANLVSFSRLLEIFQRHCHYRADAEDRLDEIRTAFFERFFCFLQQDGVNEDGDQQLPFLKGHVQIMTIHHAKGLEFPVVIVGRLDKAQLYPFTPGR